MPNTLLNSFTPVECVFFTSCYRLVSYTLFNSTRAQWVAGLGRALWALRRLARHPRRARHPPGEATRASFSGQSTLTSSKCCAANTRRGRKSATERGEGGTPHSGGATCPQHSFTSTPVLPAEASRALSATWRSPGSRGSSARPRGRGGPSAAPRAARSAASARASAWVGTILTVCFPRLKAGTIRKLVLDTCVPESSGRQN